MRVLSHSVSFRLMVSEEGGEGGRENGNGGGEAVQVDEW